MTLADAVVWIIASVFVVFGVLHAVSNWYLTPDAEIPPPPPPLALLRDDWRERMDAEYSVASQRMRDALNQNDVRTDAGAIDDAWAFCAYLKELEQHAERLEQMIETVNLRP